MAAWQIIALLFFVVLPVALLYDFWPRSERLTGRGQPLRREWRRQVHHDRPADDERH